MFGLKRTITTVSYYFGSRLRFTSTLLTLLVMIGTADAATYTVTNTDDGGAGSLRDAITQANALAGADAIQFQAGLSGTVLLTTGSCRRSPRT